MLVVGLGNPGSEYAQTRHNIGRMVLESLASDLNLNLKEKFKGYFAKTSVKGEEVIVLLPETYMNLSGESVLACSKFFKIKPEEILIVHDEIDLPFGNLAFKKGGGLAGNNGLKSVTSCLGTQDFLRFRLGVGRPAHGNVASYVLSRFSGDEQISLEKFITVAKEALILFFEKGMKDASGKYNRKNILEM